MQPTLHETQLHRNLGLLGKSSSDDRLGIWAQLDKSSGRNSCSTLWGFASFEANYLRNLDLGLGHTGDAESVLNMLDPARAETCLL